MTSLLGKRSSMVLFHNEIGHQSHKVRIVLSEKGITADLEPLDPENLPKEILEVNPKGFLPLLIDRELALYKSQLIVEYLDERFPHPPLLPVYPVARANIRLYIKRIVEDWCSLFDRLVDENLKPAEEKKIRTKLKSLIVASNPIFKEKPFFMNEEFSLVDCCIAPILWRLPQVGIEIPNDVKNKHVNAYMKRVFTRVAFIDSLTESEREMRSL